MINQRRFLTATAALGLTIVAALVVIRIPLPNPNSCSQGDLLHWIVSRDLAREPVSIKDALVDRLEAEILAGVNFDVSRGVAELSDERSSQMRSNIELLNQHWFVSRCEASSARDGHDRVTFLLEKISVLQAWSGLKKQVAQPSEPATADFFQQIDTWIANASVDRHQQMRQAVGDGLVVWLATCDLATQSPATRRDLSRRIVQRMDGGMRLNKVGVVHLNDEQRQQLRGNGELLTEAWLHNRVDDYFQLAESERSAYIDLQIEKVQRWGLIEFLATGETKNNELEIASLPRLLLMINNWIERADEDQRPRMRQVVSAVQSRLIARQTRAEPW